MKKINLEKIQLKKNSGEKITMLTAYDYPMGQLLDKAGVDIILVGDSLANVVLGLESTTEVGMDEMLHHAKAVRRGVTHSFLIGDMPYSAYQPAPDEAVVNAKRFIDEAGCDAVKLEWFEGCLSVAKNIIAAGIPVMGHVGLTPQTAEQLGGFKVQGKTTEKAEQIIEQAKALQRVGCFSIVLECIPDKIAETMSAQIKIPTIGIGAGPCCDGQVLVTHDLLGLFERFQPKFAKQYVNLSEAIVKGVQNYCHEVKEGQFPDAEHSYQMNSKEWDKMEGRPV